MHSVCLEINNVESKESVYVINIKNILVYIKPSQNIFSIDST